MYTQVLDWLQTCMYDNDNNDNVMIMFYSAHVVVYIGFLNSQIYMYMYMHVYVCTSKLSLISLEHQYVDVLNSTSLPSVSWGKTDKSDHDLICIIIIIIFFCHFLTFWLKSNFVLWRTSWKMHLNVKYMTNYSVFSNSLAREAITYKVIVLKIT